MSQQLLWSLLEALEDDLPGLKETMRDPERLGLRGLLCGSSFGEAAPECFCLSELTDKSLREATLHPPPVCTVILAAFRRAYIKSVDP